MKTLACAGAVVLASLLSACGSGGLSHGELVARANADCRGAVRAAAALDPPGVSYMALNRYAKGLSPIVQRLVGELGSLSARPADRGPLGRYVAALRAGSGGVDLLASAHTQAQVSRAVALIGAQPVSALAHTLGASACATTPQP